MKILCSCILLALLAEPGQASDVLWDNGKHDGRNGFGSCRSEGDEYWAADDFIVRTPWRITSAKAEFYVRQYRVRPLERVDIAIWKQPSPGAKPGDLIVEQRNLPVQEQTKVGEGFELPIMSMSVADLDIELPPGDYYFSMRPVANEYGDWAYLCTAGNGSIQGWTGGWSFSLYTHGDQWNRVWYWFSEKPILLATSDLAFTLYGERM